MKKTFAVALALVLTLALLAGCGNKAAPSTETPAPAAEASAPTDQATAPVPATESEPTPEPEPAPDTEGAVTMPLVAPGEDFELTWWYVLPPRLSSIMDTPTDNQFFEVMEELTGVHVEAVWASTEKTSEQFAIMVAGGDYCDVIATFENNYAGGADAGIEDGIIWRLNDYLTDYAPNYNAVINESESKLKCVTTDNGNIARFANFSENATGTGFGLVVRQDWLDSLGLATPVTYDELTDVLTAFQSELGVANPLACNYSGVHPYDIMVTGFNCLGGYYLNGGTPPFYQVDGAVKYGPIQPEFKQYLTQMNEWYNAGFISSNFTSVGDNTKDTSTELIYGGKVGVFVCDANTFGMHTASQDDPAFHIVALADPVQKAGDVNHFTYIDTKGSTGVCISTNCDEEKLKTVMRWIDYCYSTEGNLLCNYGVKGVSFEYDESGKPYLTELVTHNPEGIILNQALEKFCRGNNSNFPFVIDENRSYASYSEDELAAGAIWMSTSDGGSWIFPKAVTLTAEEASTFAAAFSDINTYVSENIVKFIIGDKPLSEFDAFTAEIEAMGVTDCIAIKQAGLDRYNNR